MQHGTSAILTSKPDIPRLPDTVSRSMNGDVGAFEALYRENVGRVYAVCLRMSADRDQAEEYTQQTFIRAWRGIAEFRGESAFSSWLHRIAVNTVLVGMRSRRRLNAYVASSKEMSDIEEPSPRPEHGLSMDLEAAIALLPPQARAVFVLHDIEGYTHDEIGEMLGVVSGTSKAQLHRARKILKEYLK